MLSMGRTRPGRAAPLPQLPISFSALNDKRSTTFCMTEDNYELAPQLWDGTVANSPSGDGRATLVEVVTSFERHSFEADQLADSACSDAARVATHAVETRQLTEERGKQTEAGNRIAASESAQRTMLGSWTAVWEPAGLAPLNPSKMTNWRSALAGLLDRRERLKGLRVLLWMQQLAASNPRF
jgi:hypothetical protein